MQGFIDKNKKIMADNGNVYELFEIPNWIKDGVLVHFDIENDMVVNLEPLDKEEYYEVPTSLFISEHLNTKVWNNIFVSEYMLITPICISRTEAKVKAKKYADALGVNALLDFRIFRCWFGWVASATPAQVGRISENHALNLKRKSEFVNISRLIESIKPSLHLRFAFACLLSLFCIFIGFLPFLNFILNFEYSFNGLIVPILCFICGCFWSIVFLPRFAKFKLKIKQVDKN